MRTFSLSFLSRFRRFASPFRESIRCSSYGERQSVVVSRERERTLLTALFIFLFAAEEKRALLYL